MTKEELIRFVILELGGGNTPASVEAKYTPQMVEKALELAFDDLCYQAYAFGLKTGNYDNLDMYVRSYKMKVLTDTVRDEKYSIIPVIGTSVPDTVALRLLSPVKGQRLAFAPIENYSIPVWNELEVNQVDSRVSFYIENGHIYYDEKLPQEITEVMGKIVSPFSTFLDTDTVFVPFGQNTALLTQTIQLLSRQAQPSNNDDMTSKQV
jgi:hypothetical protein